MNKQVLIVDDDEIIRETVKKILEREGYEVLTAENGEKCLAILDTGFNGLVLMDIMMPGMDGWETIETMIQKGHANGNIICMLTGKEKPDQKMDELKEYILDYIRKPIRNEQLAELVKQYLSYLS